MSGPEKKVENQIKKYLDSLGAYYLKVHGSMYQPAGTPDVLACVNGYFVAIEVKRPSGGVVSALQKSKSNASSFDIEIVKESYFEYNFSS